MPQDWSWVTTEMFDRAVREIAAGLDVLDIPGVWEIVAEELNNDALDLLASERWREFLEQSRSAHLAAVRRGGVLSSNGGQNE